VNQSVQETSRIYSPHLTETLEYLIFQLAHKHWNETLCNGINITEDRVGLKQNWLCLNWKKMMLNRSRGLCRLVNKWGICWLLRILQRSSELWGWMEQKFPWTGKYSFFSRENDVPLSTDTVMVISRKMLHTGSSFVAIHSFPDSFVNSFTHSSSIHRMRTSVGFLRSELESNWTFKLILPGQNNMYVDECMNDTVAKCIKICVHCEVQPCLWRHRYPRIVGSQKAVDVSFHTLSAFSDA
jgi:hypothetical protein